VSFWGEQRVLVVMPHADDETFGCGGTMARVKAEGGEVFVVVAAVGDLRHYDPEHPAVTGDQRAREFRDAMETLGVDDFEVLFNDPQRHMRLDALPRLDLVRLIESEGRLSIDRVRPTVLILPAVSYNQDHEALFKAGFAACRPHLPSVKPFVRVVLAADAPQLAWNHSPFHPNFYVDITGYLDRKLQAHACHRSQLRPPPHHASLEHIERLARVRGAEVAVEAAEAFYCYRYVA
jgi:LmbE family N-acetylglucosaminyl deacetylase